MGKSVYPVREQEEGRNVFTAALFFMSLTGNHLLFVGSRHDRAPLSHSGEDGGYWLGKEHGSQVSWCMPIIPAQ